MRWWLLAAGLAACVRSQAVTCADGTLCPEGFVCVAAGGCRQVGVCGNGTLDLDEECDDGNVMSHDGCSSACLIEQPTWHDITDPAGPVLRRGHSMVWIPDRGAGMLEGGIGVARTPETWVWDGAWTRAGDGPDRSFGAIAYAGQGRVLQFGGALADGTASGESFVWDGTSWHSLGVSGPLGRFFHVMSRDAARGTVVLLGGVTQPAGVAHDTWRWDGAWQRFDDLIVDEDLRMSYVPRDNVVVLAGSNKLRVYVWSGSWAARESSLVRHRHAQDWDSARQRLVAFAGDIEGTLTNEVDEWDGVDWRRVATSDVRPPSRRFAEGFYDPIRHGFVIFGGDGLAAGFLGDTWILRWASATPDDACDGTSDADGDGLSGCADPDCWARCTPLCPPGAACDPAAPHCGDGACNPALETHDLCPADC